MERKKTIIVAALINAGLLMILFVASITRDDTYATSQLAESDVSYPEPLPLKMEKTALFEEYKEEPIIHQLPPIAVSLPVPQSVQVVENSSSVTIAATNPPVTSLLEVIVQKGDSLEKIAKKHSTTVADLLKCNQLTTTFLKVGQKLKIPSEKKIPAPVAVNDGTEYYTMKVGDNPWSIAMKHHIKVDELLKLNGLNEEKARKLKPGDRLKIR